LLWGWDGGKLRVVSYRGHLRHSGRALRRYVDRQAIELATVEGRRLVTASQAAERLGIRPCDLNHLIRTGWLQATAWVHSHRHRHGIDPTVTDIDPTVTDQTVPLYRIADLDALLDHPAFDWDEIRATPRGRRSALAQLATNPCHRNDRERGHRWPIDGRGRSGTEWKH
jgi:hypothetical protein